MVRFLREATWGGYKDESHPGGMALGGCSVTAMAAVATVTTVAGLGLADELGRPSVKDGLAGSRTEMVPLALMLGLELGLLPAR